MLDEELERLRARVEDVANREKDLLRRLNATMSEVEDELLAEVRDLVVQHSARRAAVLSELKALSDRIGTVPAARALREVAQDEAARAELPPPAPGDWRRAAMAVADAEDDVVGLLQANARR